MRFLATIFALSVLASAASATVPLVPPIYNPSFDQNADGWSWNANNGVKASIRAETNNPHTGEKCLVFTNETPTTPNVYGRLAQNVQVLPDMEYELSVWVRAQDVTSGSHFTDWGTYGLDIPAGTYGWKKISSTFKTKPNQNSVQLGLNINNTCKELAIDDIFLKPIGTPIKGDGIDGSFLMSSKVVGHDAAGYILIFVDSLLDKAATIEATITGTGDSKVFGKSSEIRPGENRIDWEWNSGKVAFGEFNCVVRVLDAQGKVLTEANRKAEKFDSPISADIDKAEARFNGEFMSLYKKCQAKKVPLDYPTVAKTMLEQFIPLARHDIQNGHDWRAKYAAQDFHNSLDKAIAEMNAYLKDPKTIPNVRRFQTSKVKIDGISFIGDRKDTKGKKDRGPVFFVGYGHFSRTRTDMPLWPKYGVNIIQSAEFGPAQIFTTENEINYKFLNEILKAFDDAAKNNVRVDLLLSPHYFPGWAYEKWPQLGKGGGGFFGFCVDETEAKQVLEKFLRLVVPMFKDHPALNSFCLSNEPSFERAFACDNTKPMWESYLSQLHGDVDTMNKRYGTSYTSFAEVPIPGWQSYDNPSYIDYCTFLQERFANWHKWMADTVHKYAPNVPVHAKFRVAEVWYRPSVDWGIDPELFGKYMDINGNDCYFTGYPGEGWSCHWQLQNIGYDLQRSFVMKPIFNSENHPTLDRCTDYVPTGNFTTCLWQGAVHGQGATTIWVWERTDDPAYDFYGNVMDHPGCAQAVGTTCLDLNRFADEVTALQKVKAPVAILFSMASITRSANYIPALQRVYTALNFCGVKVDFISEKQIQAGKGADYKMIVLPDATSVYPATFEAMGKLTEDVRLVNIGNSLAKDPYGKAYPGEEFNLIRDASLLFDANADSQEMWPVFLSELKKRNTLSEVSVVDSSTGQPVWGVEWLPVKIGKRTIINIINLTEQPVKVKFLSRNKEIMARDLLSLGGSQKVCTLKPMVPVLAEIKR